LRKRDQAAGRGERTRFPLFGYADGNPLRMRRALLFLDFLRQLEKVPGLFVTCLYLKLGELSRFLIREERNQRFKFGCRLVRMFSLSDQQMVEFPESLIVIHTSPFHDLVITPNVFRRINWTMVLAIPSYRGSSEQSVYYPVPLCPIYILVAIDTFVQ
jgi:hypothetical protein